MIGTTAAPDAQAQIAGVGFAMILLDPTHAIAEVNPAAEALLEQGAKRLVGRSLLDVIEVDNFVIGARPWAQDAPIFARGLTVRVGQRALLVDLTISPLVSDPGWRAVTLSEIAHEPVAFDDEQSASLRAPEILAHEIKNPLSAIRGAAQLLARRLEGGDLSLTMMITGEVDRIASLVDRMQILGRRSVDPLVPFNIHEAVRNALGCVRAAGLDGIVLAEQFDPSLPSVLGSRAALEQVLINLIMNARDACGGHANGTVTVRTRFASGSTYSSLQSGRSVRLPVEVIVTDNGPGVDAGLRDHLFEPFVTSKADGQGLGLALARKLVRDMHGRIAHERDDRAGLTHFRLHLPVAQPEGTA